MFVLESNTTAPKALTQLVIESAGQNSIQLQAEEVNRRNGNNWEPDPDNVRQVVIFNDAEGQPSKLTGTVAKGVAVALKGSAHKVVIECEIAIKKTAAREAGGFSGQFASLSVHRVIEVWTDAKKPAWKAETANPGAPSAEFDPATGKVTKAA